MSHSVASKQQIITRLLGAQQAIRRLGVKRLALFGSFARDAASDESDIDLLVEFSPGRKSFTTFMQLQDLLEDLLGRRIELVTVDALSPFIGPTIKAEAEDVLRAA